MKDEAMDLVLEALILKTGMNPVMQSSCYVMHPEALQAVIDEAIKQALAAPTSADYAMGYAEGFNDGCKPAPVQDVDWKDMYEKEKRRSEMWVAKYEKDIGPLEYAVPVASPVQEPVANLWKCLGRWSAYLVDNGAQADCAPPSWLVDAVKKATTPTAAQPAVPDAIGPNEDENPAYAAGWNDCRAEMLGGKP
jgi:hypothetical protein